MITLLGDLYFHCRLDDYQGQWCLRSRSVIRSKIELLEQHSAALVRTQVKWMEEGEKNAKYFLNLEKSKLTQR